MPELIGKSHGWVLAAEEDAGTDAVVSQAPTHMSEALRTTVSKIVILPINGDASESVTGTYGKETPGLAGGIAKGSGIGSVPVEVGHVPVNIPIPLLRELGMLVGGITGSAQRQGTIARALRGTTIRIHHERDLRHRTSPSSPGR